MSASTLEFDFVEPLALALALGLDGLFNVLFLIVTLFFCIGFSIFSLLYSDAYVAKDIYTLIKNTDNNLNNLRKNYMFIYIKECIIYLTSIVF